MRYVVLETTQFDPAIMGGKAAALAALKQANLPIPAWFVITPKAFYDSLSYAQRATKEINETHARVMPSSGILAEINAALGKICPPGEKVAVRSSAVDEDGAVHSFAGQLDSFLFVSSETIAEKVAGVWRSGFSDRILIYRRENKLSQPPTAPAVLVQLMIDADVAGVAFGADPVSGQQGVVVVSAVYGLGTSLVSGESDADTWHVSRRGEILSREIADKTIAHYMDTSIPEGVRAKPVEPALASQPALTDEQVVAVAQLVRHATRHFNRPQDIEWAMKNGKLYLLQSRPITSITMLADPDGATLLWDNSNIIESYGGITTPLTFSFARNVYREVYRQFVKIMGVPEAVVADNANVFANMLGLMRGRVYYNLYAWYRVLAMLPGFNSNRRFMEQMMGVKEALPESVVGNIVDLSFKDRMKDRFSMIVALVGFLSNHFVIDKKIEAFYLRLNQALKPLDPCIEDMRADELAAHFRDLERRLLTRWDAPPINDFFCMIFFGTLKKLTFNWCHDTDGTLQNDLMCGQGGMISAEPAKRLIELGEIAVMSETLVTALRKGTLEEILREIELLPAFKAKYDEYLEKFGDRCLDELKLESATLHDDPLLLLHSVGQYAERLKKEGAIVKRDVETELRDKAEKRVRQALAPSVFRRVVFNWVLRHARARMVGRENLRFERTRLFGRVRRVFLEIGKRLYSLGLLNDARDVFYLELHEVLGFIEGTTTTVNLKGLVAVRKADFEQFRSQAAPDDRFETRGIVNQGNAFVGKIPIATHRSLDPNERKGMGCCPGSVRGSVRVVRDPKNAKLNHGEIIVAERTDPGWIMLFPCASALLVERGSLLSHAAIVSREMGIPSIVSLAGVTTWLKDGDWIEMDGSTGIVRKIEEPIKGAEKAA